MKLLIVGDFNSNTGPSSVNKVIREAAKESISYSLESNIFKRIIELIIKTKNSDAVLFSGLSKINLLGFVIAKLYNKKYAYLMHGCKEYEDKLNAVYNKKANKLERKVLSLAPKIICVSLPFMEWAKYYYPEYKEKITFINNAIKWDYVEQVNNKIKRDKYTILSVGGSIPRKNMIPICEAINQLNKDSNPKFKFIIIGEKGLDFEKIISYDFIEYIENIPYSEMKNYYLNSNIYIQNSIFETFGLAPLEALASGCNVVVSKYVGALSVFKEMRNDYIISNPNDINEIIDKIKKQLDDPNNKYMTNQIDRRSTNVEYMITKIKQELCYEK